jgi:hypothetical protein
MTIPLEGPTPDDPKGELVGSGSFHVDRAKALEVLKRYQFADPSQFILSLVRCAVLGGASVMEVRGWSASAGMFSTGEGIEVTFDGNPFTPAQLADPFAAYFDDESAKDRRLIELARAVLTLEGTEPEELRLAPRSVRAVWGGSSRAAANIVEWLRMHCERCPIPILFHNLWRNDGDQRKRGDGKVGLAIPQSLLGAVEFSVQGARGRLVIPDRPAINGSRIELMQAGVLAEVMRANLPGAFPVDGFVDDPGFSLSMSQTSVVADERFLKTMEGVAAESQRLVLQAVAVQRARMPQTCKLMEDQRNREVWRDVLEGFLTEPERPGILDAVARFFGRRVTTPEQGRQLYMDAARTRWLRAAFQSLPASSGRFSSEAATALWESPLFFSGRLEPLSLKDIERMAGKPGFTLIGLGRCDPPSAPAESLWLSSSRDRASLPDSVKSKPVERSQGMMPGTCRPSASRSS